MSALIYVDLAHVHPVVDGVWHQADLFRVPESGDSVRMLCGVVAAAEYADNADRRTHTIPTQCQDCAAIFQRRRNSTERVTGQLPGPRARSAR